MSGRSLLQGLLIFAMVIAVLVYFGKDPLGVPADDETRPSVILISIDTLRAQSIGCYGYERDVTPHLDRFAQDAILFEDAYTVEPQTLPSHTSLLTGLYPESHGVLPTQLRKLSPTIPTLADLLGNDGRATGAFVNVQWLEPRFGLSTAFHTYDYFPQNNENKNNEATRFGRSARETNEDVLDWIDGRDGGSVFAFIHYFDVHSDIDRLPYDSPASYREKFAGDYQGDFDGGDGTTYASSFLNLVNENRVTLAEEDVRYIRDLYDAGIAYTDAQIGKLMDELRARGLYDSSLILIVADHGEEFLEHGKTMHTQLYEENLRVPLLIKLPNGEFGGRRISGPVSLIDVMPTVAEVLDLPLPESVDGVSLAPYFDLDEASPHETLVYNYDLRKIIGLRVDRHKLITHREFEQAVHLYDLTDDPEERDNLASKHPDRTIKLRKLIRFRLSELSRRMDPAAEGIELTEEDRAVLEALGYTGLGR